MQRRARRSFKFHRTPRKLKIMIDVRRSEPFWLGVRNTIQTVQPPGQSAGTRAKWLVLAAAFLGWMFDGLEMGIFPQIARQALGKLLPGASLDSIKEWHQFITAMFLFGAALGGLVFGWLGDKIGRVKAMSTSILV